MDLKTKDGRESLFWSISNPKTDIGQIVHSQYRAFDEVNITDTWKKVARRLLARLLNDCRESVVSDGTPIINLVILAGKKFQMKCFSDDLIDRFLSQISHSDRSREHVRLLCPYSNESTIDVLIRSTSNKRDYLHIDLLKLSEQGAEPNRRSKAYWEIVQEIINIKREYHIPIKLPEFKPKKELILSTKQVEIEVMKMAKMNNVKVKNFINSAFVPQWSYGEADALEAKITENVVLWLRNALNSCPEEFKELSNLCEVRLSGSLDEGCRLKTKGPYERSGVDEYEIDLIIAAKLDVQ